MAYTFKGDPNAAPAYVGLPDITGSAVPALYRHGSVEHRCGHRA